MEVLTLQIADEYRRKAKMLQSDGFHDIGERRELREELQKRCNLTELQAVNIINGFHIRDYVATEQIKAEEKENGN